jgi:glycosyltransferase involved in cell wall biosynthesis
MYFSVIIPSYNEASHIRQCIESVKTNDNTKADYEIIVADNGSTDGSVEIVKALGINIIENTEGIRKSIATLRNLGAKQSRGDIFAFLDADMIVPDNWLLKANEYFSNGFKGVLGFVEKVPDSAGWVGKTWGNRAYQKLDKITYVDFLPGRNLFINRTVFEEIKGFNETLITAEDKDFTLRVFRSGYKVMSVPDIAVTHLGYEKNLVEFIRKEFWRQGHTLSFAKQSGFSARTLRNPILSFWHISMLSIILFSVYFQSLYFIFLLLFIWITPAAAITLSKIDICRSSTFVFPFFLLTFLQWNISGFALLMQLFSTGTRRK